MKLEKKVYVDVEILEILEEKGDCSAPSVGSITDELWNTMNVPEIGEVIEETFWRVASDVYGNCVMYRAKIKCIGYRSFSPVQERINHYEQMKLIHKEKQETRKRK